MKYGPLIFLAAFFALASSWVTFVLGPQLQVGQLQQTNSVGLSATYPVARPGLAREGLEVYRANGCQYCHSQQVGQTGTAFDLALVEPGTNQTALLDALLRVNPGTSEAEAKQLLVGLPKVIRREANKDAADAAAKLLNVGGTKAAVWVVPVGPDLARGWGKRRTVAEDYLFEYPVMLGSRRVGPDLANVGVRQPDPNWHLRHLYAPQREVKGSTMPSYRFLFQKRRINGPPSPEALVFEGPPPAPGYEILPTTEAKALAVYLISLYADTPLFDAPFTGPVPASAATTNAPAPTDLTSTNAAPTNAPAK